MSLRKTLSGTGVALVTPFDYKEAVDYTALGKLIDFDIENGVEYVITLGTTGETPTLTKQEKLDIVNFTYEKVNGRVPVVVGIGGNSTSEVIENLKNFPLEKATAVLSASPYYNKPSQEGIFQHYKALDAATPLPIIMYNVPGRTGMSVSAETTLRIANECPNIFATKEASGNFDLINQLIKNKPDHFMVISGDDPITLQMIAGGAEGLISVVANAYPKEYSDMVRLCLAGKFTEAEKLHSKYLDIIASMFAEGSPSGVKAYLSEMGLCQNTFRLPVWKVSEKHLAKIKELMKGV